MVPGSRDRAAIADLPRPQGEATWKARLDAGVFTPRGAKRYDEHFSEARRESVKASRRKYDARGRNKIGAKINCRNGESAAGLWGNQYWTPEEYEFARHWFSEGRSYRVIAYALQRSVRSVRDKMQDPDGSKRRARDKNKPEYQGDFAARQRLKVKRGATGETNPNSRTRFQNRRPYPE